MLVDGIRYRASYEISLAEDECIDDEDKHRFPRLFNGGQIAKRGLVSDKNFVLRHQTFLLSSLETRVVTFRMKE